MIEVLDTPHQAVVSLLTGHFRETSGYRAVRRNGVGDWLLIQTVSGRGRFGYHGGELLAEPGDWVLLRPGAPHDYGVEPVLQHWDLVWAHFQPRADWLPLLAWPEVAPGLMRLRPEDDSATELGRRLLEVHDLLTGQQPRREAFAMNALEALLLNCDLHNDRAAPTGDRRINLAMDYLEGHLAAKVLIEDVAAAVGLSPSRLAHLFKDQTGETLQGHLEARRMQVAADLLRRTSFPIKQIAATSGFESPFYFSQRFRKWTGLSPMQFRRRQDTR
jgi:AraC family transcriptional regulator of arabinose operon